MKINELGAGQAIQKEQEISRKKAPAASRDFQDLLTQELDTKTDGAKDNGMALEGMGPVNGSLSIYPQISSAVSDSTKDSATSVEGLAAGSLSGSLGDIERSIGGGKASLKVVDGTIEKLSEQADSFQKSVGGLPADHPLREVGDQLSSLAYVESVKWKRGDYT